MCVISQGLCPASPQSVISGPSCSPQTFTFRSSELPPTQPHSYTGCSKYSDHRCSPKSPQFQPIVNPHTGWFGEQQCRQTSWQGWSSVEEHGKRWAGAAPLPTDFPPVRAVLDFPSCHCGHLLILLRYKKNVFVGTKGSLIHKNLFSNSRVFLSLLTMTDDSGSILLT